MLFFHSHNAIINIFEQLAQLVGRYGAECHADKARKHDSTRAVVADELLAELFGIYALGFYAHEVAAVAGHGLEGVLVFGVVGQHLLDDVVALLEDGELLGLLLQADYRKSRSVFYGTPWTWQSCSCHRGA